MTGVLTALALSLLLALGAATSVSQPACTDKVDILIMVDASGSISANDFTSLKGKIAHFVSLPFEDLDVNFAFVQFGTFVTGILSFEDQLDPALVAEYFLFYDGQQSFLNRALEEAAPYFQSTRGARPEALKYLVIYSDGQPTLPAEAVEEAGKLMDLGVTIIGVGVGAQVSFPGLMELTSRDLHFDGSDLNVLDDVSSSIEQAIKDYAQGLCSACPSKVDVVIVVDGSGSISEDYHNTLKSRVANLVSDSFGGLDTQYSFIHIGTFPHSVTHFNYLVEPAFVANNFLFYEGQQTFIASALDLILQHFEYSRGHRLDAVKVVILYTDGENSESDGGLAAASAAAQLLKSEEIILFTVGIANAEMANIATFASDGLGFDGTDLSQMDQVTAAMNQEMELIIDEKCAVAPCVTPTEADVLIVMDASGSIPEETFELARMKIAQYVAGHSIGGLDTQYAFMTYSYFVSVASEFTSPMGPEIVAEFLLLYEGQQSRTEEALKLVPHYFSEVRGHRPNAMKLVILLTDGVSTDSLVTLQEAQALMEDDYHIFGVGLGPDLNMVSLRELVNEEAYPVYNVETDLLPTFHLISTMVENEVATKCEDPCPEGVDVVFVIDASASVTEPRFNAIKDNHLPAMINALDATGLSMAYSFITYSTLPTSHFDFKLFVDIPFITPAMASTMLLYEGQQSYMGKAMEMAHLFLTEDYGARPTALKHVFLFTDFNFTAPSPQDSNVESVVMQMESEGVTVVDFGFGASVDTAYLTARAANNDYVFDASDLTTMTTHSATVSDLILTRVNQLCGN